MRILIIVLAIVVAVGFVIQSSINKTSDDSLEGDLGTLGIFGTGDYITRECSIMINRKTAQVGNRVATVCTPIIETSTPSGRTIPEVWFAAINPNVDKAIGTIPKRIAPNMNAFFRSFFFIEKALCQYC